MTGCQQGAIVGSLMALAVASAGMAAEPPVSQKYRIAFASFAPLDTDVFIADADGSNARPFLAHPGLDYNASFSRDGSWIVFTSRRDGSADIYRAHPDGSGLEQLIDHPAFDDQAALSPDGKSLAFVSSRSGQADIWILDLATRTLRNLTNHPAGDFRPSWSPDGQWLAFSSDRDSTHPRATGGFATLHSTEVYLVAADGSGVRRITKDQAIVGGASWSPDGNRLAVHQASLLEAGNILSPRRLRGTTQIGTIDLRSGERVVLTSGDGEKWSPRWLADGRVGYVSGGPEGGIEFTSGGPGVRGEFRSPNWSTDGRQVVFHRDVGSIWPPLQAVHSLDPLFPLVRSGVFPSSSPSGGRLVTMTGTAAIVHNSLLTMNADGTQRSVLFDDPRRNALAPAWSNQGDQIAFSLGQFFQMTLGAAPADVVTIRSDGSGLRILTDGKANYGFPSWSGDGQHIVYRESRQGRNVLHIVDVSSREHRVLIGGTAHYNFPGWSPTSDVIAFTSDQDGDYEIYSIRPDGTDLKRLTHRPGNDAHSSWSPDGKWLAFATARGWFKDEAILRAYNPQPYGEIAVMRADGSDVRVLTDDQFEDATPGWVPVRGQAQTDVE
jgi:Tol biopolymer transport system component